MQARQIMLQLFSQLPKYSDYFATKIPVSSLSLTSTTVTATTPAPHGLSVNQTVNMTGAIIKNPIIELTQDGNVALATTQYDHDLTENYNFIVRMTGANQSEYNGDKTLLTVPNRRQFTYAITGDPPSPATGTIFLIEFERSINPYTGLKVITSVPTTTTFTYEISQLVYSPPTGTIYANTGLRIGGAMDFEKCDEWYSKQGRGKYWLFVVLGDRSASKDRHTDDDATATTPVGTRYRERVITPFTCYVFAPLPDSIDIEGVNGRAVRDTMEDIFFSLCKSVLRKKFQTLFSETNWSEVMFVNHGFYGYNQAYYIHQFSFESTFDITFSDTIMPDENVAFRDIELDFQRLTDDQIIASMSENLDDEPYED